MTVPAAYDLPIANEYRKTRTTGLYVRHSRDCPAYNDDERRCRCEPSYRTRRRIDGTPRWSPVFKDRASAVAWDGQEAKAEQAIRAIRRQGPTFEDVAREWWALVEAGTYARRRGRSKRLARSTIADYRGVLFGPRDGRETNGSALIERCGREPVGALDDAYWQSFIDELVRSGRSYSRVATYLAVVRHVYAYARRANRRLVPVDPTRDLEMPANDGKPRERVATKGEAARLVEAIPALEVASALNWDAIVEIRRSSDSALALSRRFGVSDSLIGKVRRGELYKTKESCRAQESSDRAGWALAFYTGMRRSEIGRAQWPHVFWDADEIMVAASKSEAGEGRRIPMVGPLKTLLRQEWMRQGQPKSGPVVTRSVLSGKWQARADEVWRRAELSRITLHEARHTYASFLMAAGYNLKQIQEYLGHADLVTTARYIKNLPVPRGTTERAKLEAYLTAEIGDIES
ncbi:MAG: site-specific integrase [Actinomycetota bacterium]|nr:site-specific integrase [Actinomycetota bacterium]